MIDMTDVITMHESDEQTVIGCRRAVTLAVAAFGTLAITAASLLLVLL